ncbi:ribosome biogenesis protein, putative [Trypanosoma equiperdum]|uniref:Ribosome production factor 2 homolog n=3 Tax=Trypanozoon TaxID=39700 RepID=Q57U27_TRYB2|nr:ribosome biogenesis protein, putative [Trypanosoma brucei gambiense DAL972]XP_845651.1 ribosome biogenesis protein, putative [Trypanosoma brucei brucei TREU927]AAX70891.1 ribosome biogenesis protein, putative [Trypanosoma brucei]SCU66757.1 ribosome biogenesis protein, putative [Trypanosoma equiperdum]AAZ12092.1 ribosome biogenesis protein, putative [Trypanosoma brucei brucei TREU927]CBH12035.1 ribosome biogenesis protein, putative [Trypanosoma brucei gambiense DAL972]|eukprot:XP_011774318.1 ribosome biogenesis protein, putative [Trypanosoma brucei gambiense DAL972]
MSSIGGFKRRAPKSLKTRRALKKYDPKVVENPKKILFLRGTKTSSVVNDAIVDLTAVTKPYNKRLQKRNAFYPFDGREHLEFLGFKNDCSLFCFGNDSKKRPHNLVIGRHFDFHILDMLELGIIAADRMEMPRDEAIDLASLGGKPFFVFEGSEFVSDPTFVRLKNLLIDFFRGSSETEINLDGYDRVLSFSLRSANGGDVCVPPATDCYGTGKQQQEKGNTILCMRHYALHKPSTAAGIPRNFGANIRLLDIGPNFDFILRRASFATPAEFKVSTKLPKEVLATLRSTAANVSADPLNNLRGQLHVGKQDVQQLNLRRFKAHKRSARSATEGENDTQQREEAEGEPMVKRHRRRRGNENEDDINPDRDI